jgi:hypothetical protein
LYSNRIESLSTTVASWVLVFGRLENLDGNSINISTHPYSRDPPPRENSKPWAISSSFSAFVQGTPGSRNRLLRLFKVSKKTSSKVDLAKRKKSIISWYDAPDKIRNVRSRRTAGSITPPVERAKSAALFRAKAMNV